MPRDFAASGWVNQAAAESSVGTSGNVEKFAGLKPSGLDTYSWRTEIKVSACLRGRTKQATKAGDESSFAAADISLAAWLLTLPASIGLMGRLVGSIVPP